MIVASVLPRRCGISLACLLATALPLAAADQFQVMRGEGTGIPVGDGAQSSTAGPFYGSSTDSGRVPPKRIFFPPDPPPLDAQINFDATRPRPFAVPEQLGDFVTEPFYPALSTCLTDLSDGARQRFLPRIDAYRKKRNVLLAELREILIRLEGAPPDERQTAFSALATKQAGALAELEAETDRLREDLGRNASWYRLREWKLGRGKLHDLRPEHRVLKFELVRAAAFYQDGLLPAQRRLLREAAIEMQDEMFATEQTPNAAGIAPPPLVFFSPDLARILSADQFPAAVADLLEKYVAAKDALRRELVDAVIDSDKALWSISRRHALENLAKEQAPHLDALAAQAEALRQAYAPSYERTRPAPPLALPAELAAKIAAYENLRHELQLGLARQEAALRARIWSESLGKTVGEFRQRFDEAQREEILTYVREHGADIRRMNALLDEIHPRLVKVAGPDAIEPGTSGSAAFLIEFMRHYRQAWANYEYAIAVFEPGLSAAQRRLLFGGAMVRLQLPLPTADHQPGALPRTLLKDPIE